MREIKIVILILFNLIVLSGHSQKEIVNINFPFRTMQHFEFSKNPQGDYCLFVNKEEFYYFCYISKDGEKIYDTTIKEISSIKPAFLGVKPTNDKFIYYFLPAYSKRNLRTIIISKNKSNCKDKTGFAFFDSKKEKIVKSISFGSEFYLVTANKKSLVIYVSRFIDENSFDKKEFIVNINSEILKRYPFISAKTIIGKLLSREFPEAGYKNLNPIYSTIDNDKLIIDGSNLHFTFNEGDVVSLSWDSSIFKYNYFYDDFPTSTKDFNSFILNDNLYRVIFSPDEFFLKIYVLNNGKLLKEFHYTKDDEFNLPYFPIIKYRNTAEGYKAMDDTITEKELFRKLSRGSATIYGFKNSNDKLHLFIGSNKADQVTSIPINIPGATPTVLILPIRTFNSPSGNFVSFETILSLPDYNIIHLKDSTNFSSNSELIIWPDSQELSSFSGKVKFSETDTDLYILQFNTDKKQLLITRFEK